MYHTFFFRALCNTVRGALLFIRMRVVALIKWFYWGVFLVFIVEYVCIEDYCSRFNYALSQSFSFICIHYLKR